MRTLIIGGTGLISTAITRELQDRGADVVHYNRGQAREDFARAVPTIHGDRKDFAAFETQMAEAGRFDCVIDMICFQPAEAESAVRAFRGRTEHFIFCSTVDVYTKPAARYPITEDAERRPRASFPYAHAKAQCERIFEAAHAAGDFPVTLIRPAYTYGEGRGLLHSFRSGTYYLARLRQGRRVIVHGDGTSLWASCHRDDVGRAFAEAVGNPITHGRAYHVTSPEWMTWNQYHQQVAAVLGGPEPELIHIPTDFLFKALPAHADWIVENFQHNNIFHNHAAEDDLHFRYTMPWAEGVRRVVNWLDERGRITDTDEPDFYQKMIEQWQRIGDAVIG